VPGIEPGAVSVKTRLYQRPREKKENERGQGGKGICTFKRSLFKGCLRIAHGKQKCSEGSKCNHDKLKTSRNRCFVALPLLS
jgi:hypothetical protein